MSARANIGSVGPLARSQQARGAVVRSGVTRTRIAFVWPAVLAALVLMLVWTGPALAAYEQQSEHFGTSGEAKELEGAAAMAVNVNGAGGVQAGSFYVVGRNSRVVRFAPGAEGEEPRFEEAWGWGIAEGGPEKAYVRCGPAYHGTANPAEHTYEHCKSPTGDNGGEESGNFGILGGVAVDQTTGDVYVRNPNLVVTGELVRAHHLIEVFTPRGVPVGEGFGDSGNPFSTPPESIAEGPGKLHRITVGRSPIAVDSTGAVYVLDEDYEVEHPETRVMVFRPCTAGHYESYCYASGEDIPLSGLEEPIQLSLVGDNKLVVASIELIREYPLGGHNPAPICGRAVTGQLLAMATNSLSGDVFYFRFVDHSIRHLGPCDQATGEFPEIQKLKPEPRPIYALAVNPSLAWGPTRPPGVLYAADEKAIGDIFAPAEVASPEVQSESVANTTTVSAMLQAQIDPLGQTTKYTFQYLTLAQYETDGGFTAGVSEAPANPGEIPSGAVATVTTGVSGLVPDTSYVFRVLASGFCNPERPEEVCRASGKPAFFATYPQVPSGLSDGRAYELVSPPEKNGGEVFPADPRTGSCYTKRRGVECKPPGLQITAVFPMQAASVGDAVAYMGYPFSPNEGSAVYNSYVSRRGADAWNTTAMSPALLSTRNGVHLAYNSRLTEDVIRQPSNPQLAPQAPLGYENLYLQNVADPASLTPLVTVVPPHRATGGLAVEYGGHSPDFSAQFFAANDALTTGTAFSPEPPDPGSAGRDLYEWHDGALTLVNVLPGNAGIATNPAFASASPDAHGVSANGRRVFWQANGHLYVREDGRITREIEHSGTFLSASEDGLNVLLSDGCLYSLSIETCTDLTQGQGGFEGILGNTGDLSRIYFVDKAALTAEAKAGTCTRGSGNKQAEAEEEEGKVPPGLGCNLYVYETGAGIRFIATLAASDDSDLSTINIAADWASVANERTAEVSPDGRYLAFASTARLTGYDNVGLCRLLTNSENESVLVDYSCAEVFVYDSVTGRLVCASCNPTGEAPRGFSTLRRIPIAKPWIPQPRYVTDQGRVFFDSQDRLSSRDVNGRVEDVYEAEPQGVGSCERVSGCVLLISGGTGGVDSNFLAMDEGGANVFFTTRDRLVPADTDELLDLYDAREGGGFPGASETAGSECGDEACRPATGGSLVTSSLASVIFQGAGKAETSLPEKPLPERAVLQCPKGKVKVKERSKCVSRKKPSKQRKARAKRRRAAGRKRGGAK
jgi:hypothetical protein